MVVDPRLSLPYLLIIEGHIILVGQAVQNGIHGTLQDRIGSAAALLKLLGELIAIHILLRKQL
jgi:hypothetical protein